MKIVVKPTKITADDVSGYVGEKITFNGSITDKNNNIIKSGRVVIKLNGKTINSNITLSNSKFTWTYTVPAYVAKDYVLTYVFIGDKNNQRSELNKTFTIKSQAPKITANNVVCYKDQTATVTVKITGANTGIKAVKGTVGLKINSNTLKVDGKAVVKNITDGTVVFKFKVPSDLKAGKYQIMVTYSSGRYLLGGRANTSTLTVKDHVTKITVKIPKTKAGNQVRILASLNDSTGKIKTGNATFKLNNKVIGTAKISNGAAVLYYTIPENYLGKYTIEVMAQGTYTDVNSTKATLTVVK